MARKKTELGNGVRGIEESQAEAKQKRIADDAGISIKKSFKDAA